MSLVGLVIGFIIAAILSWSVAYASSGPEKTFVNIFGAGKVKALVLSPTEVLNQFCQ
jgi:hypothetical protein